MRSNLPVTHQEYVLLDSDTIVSKTDLKGKITYVNDDFLRISGFSEDELIGQPHNIVRHPDMPEQAFEDLWRTLKRGKAWTGMVKNRCKNGDHYWVEANVAPLIQDHRVIGYTSIRGKPSRDRIHAAEEAYRALKEGDKRLLVREGKAARRSVFDVLRGVRDISVAAKLGGAFALLGVMLAVDATLAWSAASRGSGEIAGWAVAVGVLGTLFAVMFAFLAHQSLVKPLKAALDDIEQMTSGDLTGAIRATGNDEVAQVMHALKILQINVKLLIGQISQSSDEVHNDAGEIASGVMDLSARTESQASSLEETAAAMEQLTTTIKHNVDSAHEASALVLSTSAIASKGGEAVGNVVSTMDAIKESSKRIVDIISVIDGIAFQTNILALNAAVEAARAGEQGRGFAVVASEVRTLAQRSANAAKEIKTLIGASVESVEAGSMQVANAGKTMAEIVDSVRHAADLMKEISAAGQEQSIGIDQVNQAIAQMDQITQQNAALVEQAAAASASMKGQSDHLWELVGAFKLMSGSRPEKAAGRSKAKEAVAPSPRPVAQPASRQVAVQPSIKRLAAQTAAGDWEEF